ncbi:MAG: PEP-CTERM sorting domain-containing protein [Planctomycetaceae bacterium]|nr:PEP-CTERM sorting domain-containing protein [Planctomycetaceae bacterium]
MKHQRLFLHFLLAFLLAMAPTFTFADVSGIVSGFNSMNSNRGFVFKMYNDQYYSVPPGAGEMRLLNSDGNVMPDLSAYNSALGTAGTISGKDYFQTFCVSPDILMNVGEESQGQLSYVASRFTRTTPVAANGYVGESLTFGAAFLYKQFASGALNYAYTGTDAARTADAIALQNMIWYLQGKPTVGGGSITDNKYYSYLNSALSGTGFDMYAAYDLTVNYGNFMDDYKVFVMNTSVDTALTRMPGSQARQDVLYVTRDGGGGGQVPEPASLLLWTLGGMGLAGASWRKRRMKKHALS